MTLPSFRLGGRVAVVPGYATMWGMSVRALGESPRGEPCEQ